MVEINYEQIWIDGGYNRDNPKYFENTLLAVKKRALQLGISETMSGLVIHEVMMECAEGKQYPLDECPCGCGINRSGTAITHEMFRRLDLIAEEKRQSEAETFTNTINQAVARYVKKKENTIPKRVWKRLNEPIFTKKNTAQETDG